VLQRDILVRIIQARTHGNEHDSAMEHKIAKFRSIAFHAIFSFRSADDLSGPRIKTGIALRLGGIQGEFYLLLSFNEQLTW